MTWLLHIVWTTCLISVTVQKYIPAIPKRCNSMSYCDEVFNYPEEYVSELTQKLKLDDEQYNIIDEMSLTFDSYADEKYNLSLCAVEKKIRYPRAARDRYTKKWHAVINPKENPFQGVVVELCKPGAVNKSCGNGVGIEFHSNYTSKCIQKYIYQQMKALNEDFSVIHIEAAIPCCCSCVATRL